ncbi:phosphomevalonate kinase [Streptococcus rifensis]
MTTKDKVRVQVPGKLFIAGEYGVVEGAPAIIAAVDKYLTVTVAASTDQGSLQSSQDPNLTLAWTRSSGRIQFQEDHPYALVVRAMQMAEDYVSSQDIFVDDYYSLKITSHLDDTSTGRKYGLGSSGAVTVAVLRGILAYYHCPVPALTLYKLAALTHTRLGMRGSMGDLAASSFGGLIAYQRPDRDWLLGKMAEQSILPLIDQDWPNLRIERLPLPQSLKLLAGWTKTPVSTEHLVGQMQGGLSEEQADQLHQAFLADSHSCVDGLIAAIYQGKTKAILAGIRQNRQLLLAYTKQRGILLETPLLETLIAIAEGAGAASKTSGAGGGDCGISLVETAEQALEITTNWERAGILPLDLSLAPITD